MSPEGRLVAPVSMDVIHPEPLLRLGSARVPEVVAAVEPVHGVVTPEALPRPGHLDGVVTNLKSKQGDDSHYQSWKC